MRRRAGLVALSVVLAVALVAGTWVLASHFQSPAQREASAQAPTAGPVLVAVTRGDLTERTTLNATAAAAQTEKIALPLPEGRAVLTRAGVETGSSLDSGQVAAWVNDRPVITLRGPFPLYRDLGPGDSGSDVTLVQQALADLGYRITPDGKFGPTTARCLTALYKAVGASAPTRPVQDTSADTAAQAQPTDVASAAPTAAAATAAAPSSEVYLPLSEVLVLSSTPVTVTGVPGVGTVLSADNANLATSQGGVSLKASITGPVALRVKNGMTGTAQVGSTSLDVKVTDVAQAAQADPAAQATTSTDGTDTAADSAGSGVNVTLAPSSGDVPADWAGRSDVLVTLDLTDPLTDVLTVPQRAIATAADGSSSVLAIDADGTTHQVKVTQLACVSGTCAIADPKADTGVAEGTQVRVDR